MAYFHWNEDVAVGHGQIDAQHKELFELAERVVEPLCSSGEHQAGEARLKALIEFARQHFADEEALMRSSAYPEANFHAKIHAALITELESYCARVRTQSHTNPMDLICFLAGWLTIHIQSVDLQFVEWLASL